MNKLDFKIHIVEKSLRVNNGIEFEFLIAVKPKEESIQIKVYEKRYLLIDSEIIHISESDIEIMRERAAIEVFKEFYKENFIAK